MKLTRSIFLAGVIFACALSVYAAEVNDDLSKFFSSKPSDRTVPESLKKHENLSKSEANKWIKTVWEAYDKGAKDAGVLDGVVLDVTKDAKTSQLKGIKETMPYTIFCKGEKPAGGWPLIISTHGGGICSKAVNDGQYRNQVAICQRVYSAPGIYMIPRMPNDKAGRWRTTECQIMFKRFIEAAILKLDVNPNKVYFTGISQGGYGSFLLASYWADRWAAVGPAAAGEPAGSCPPENLRNTAFVLRVGENDNAYDRSKHARNYIKLLEKLQKKDPKGYKFIFDYQKGRGHYINHKGHVTDMQKYTRNPLPQRVVWKMKSVWGQWKKQFYWLGYEEGPYSDGYVDAKIVKKDNKIVIVTREVRQLTVMLNDKMLDLNKPVIIEINKSVKFKGKVNRSLATIVKTTAQRRDPNHIFTAEVKINIEDDIDQANRRIEKEEEEKKNPDKDVFKGWDKRLD